MDFKNEEENVEKTDSKLDNVSDNFIVFPNSEKSKEDSDQSSSVSKDENKVKIRLF